MKKLLATLLCFSAISCYGYANDGHDVLANRLAETTELTFDELYKIFTFTRLQWDNGREITVIIADMDSEETRTFIRDVLKIGYLGYSRRLKNRMTTARTHPPVIAATNTELLELLSKTEGGIGNVTDSRYVDLDRYRLERINLHYEQTPVFMLFNEDEKERLE